MSLHAVDAVEVRCDGCGERFENDEYQFFLREQADDWVGNTDDWKLEDGKHYCCGWSTPKGQSTGECWPPSMRDGVEA